MGKHLKQAYIPSMYTTSALLIKQIIVVEQFSTKNFADKCLVIIICLISKALEGVHRRYRACVCNNVYKICNFLYSWNNITAMYIYTVICITLTF